jgi:hypothetical protein
VEDRLLKVGALGGTPRTSCYSLATLNNYPTSGNQAVFCNTHVQAIRYKAEESYSEKGWVVIDRLLANDKVSRTERHLYLEAIMRSTSRRPISGDPVDTPVILVASELVLFMTKLNINIQSKSLAIEVVLHTPVLIKIQ